MSSRRTACLVSLFLLLLAPCAAAQLATMTQSVTPTIVSGSVACTQGGGFATVQNDYWREYDPSTQGLTAPFFLWGANIGVEAVNTTASGSGSHPCTLSFYVDPTPGDLTSNIANLFLFAAETFFVLDTTLSVVPLRFTQPFPAFTPNGVDTLICRLDTPGVGDQFFFGSNSFGQTAPSYLSSSMCGINLPTDTNNFVPGGMMIVLDVVFDPTTNVPALGRPGTSEDLVLLTGVAGAVPTQVWAKVALASSSDTLDITLTSPNGFFANNPFLVITQLAPSQGIFPFTDVAGGFGPIWLSTDPGVLTGSYGNTPIPPFNVPQLLGTGNSTTIILPPILAGFEAGIQGLALSGAAIPNNFVYASSRHHIITLN